MKCRLRFVLVVCVIVGALAGRNTGEGQAPEKAAAEEKLAEATATHESTEMTIRIARECQAGSPALLVIEVAQKEDSEGSSYEGKANEHLALAVTDGNGQAVPLTQFGKEFFERRKREKEELTPEIKGGWTMGPGDSISYQLNLSWLFDMTLPGTYKVRVTNRMQYFSGHPFTLEATLEVKITEPPSVWNERKNLNTIRVRYGPESREAEAAWTALPRM